MTAARPVWFLARLSSVLTMGALRVNMNFFEALTMNRQLIKDTALGMVAEIGLINLSRRAVCDKAGIPNGSFHAIMDCSFAEFLEELRKESSSDKNHIVTKTRTNPKLRKEQILNAAVELAKTDGFTTITRDKIAESAGVSRGLVSRYFGLMQNLKRNVMRRAVAEGIPEIVAQGLAIRDAEAIKAPTALKLKAVKILTQ